MTKSPTRIACAAVTLSLIATACSRDDGNTGNTMVVETADPMTNLTNDSLGNQIDTLNTAATREPASETGSVVNTTGDMATDATTTVGSTASSGPSTTRETRGEKPPQ